MLKLLYAGEGADVRSARGVAIWVNCCPGNTAWLRDANVMGIVGTGTTGMSWFVAGISWPKTKININVIYFYSFIRFDFCLLY